MADLAPRGGVVIRAANDGGTPKPASEPVSAGERAGRLVLWAVLLLVGVGTLAPIIRYAGTALRDTALVQADEATIRRQLSQTWSPFQSADYLETLSELALQLPTPETDRALEAARRAVAADPSRAFAWTTIAYLESEKAGRATPEAIEALGKSMDACPFCSVDLVRWRFNFVLSNWDVIPDAMRRRAFEQADMLRWTPGNGEFLGDMQARAERADLPYDAYRAAVKTPLSSWDIAPIQP